MSKSLYTTIKENVAPTSTTEGVAGQFYIDQSTTPADLYLCTKVETVGGVKVYTWTKQGGGSGESIYDANGNAYINSTNDGLKVYSAKDSSNNYGTTISAGGTTNSVAMSVDSENTQINQGQVYSDSGTTYTITNQDTTAQTGITKTAKIKVTQDTTTTETYKETTVLPEGVMEEYATKDGSGVGIVVMGDTGVVQCIGNTGGKIGLQASGDKGQITSGDYANKKLEVNFENESGDSVVKEIAFTDDLNTKLDKTGGAITGNLTIQGDLTVTGETTTERQKDLEVEDNFIYTNANKVELTALLSGLAIYKNGTDIYAIAYDPVSDSVKLGLCTRNEQGVVTFNTGEGSPVAVRADSADLTDNHIIIWDATNHKFIDSGKTIADLDNRDIAVELNVPSSATNGTLTASQLQILQSNNSNYIILDHEIYTLKGSGHREGYLTYNCNEYENSTATTKFITITINTLGWVLNTVDIPTKTSIVDMVYPVGSLYLSVANVSPQTLFGGTWEILDADYCLMTASRTTMPLGEKIPAGLPNLTGTFCGGDSDFKSGIVTSSVTNSSKVGSGSAEFRTFTIDASQGGTDPIYGKSTTVQPPAIQVAVWKRTA